MNNKLDIKYLDLFYVCNEYLSFLYDFDNKVLKTSGNKQYGTIYVGAVFNINGLTYFAPLVSPKKKHSRLLENDPTTFKIIHKDKLIGSVLLNNMIPVKSFALRHLNINDIINSKYKDLLFNQIRVLRSNKEILADKAFILYDNVINQRNPYFNRISCNFKKLEEISQFFTAEDVIKQ